MGLLSSIFGGNNPRTAEETGRQVGLQLLQSVREVESLIPNSDLPENYHEIVERELLVVAFLSRRFAIQLLIQEGDQMRRICGEFDQITDEWVQSRGELFADLIDIRAETYWGLTSNMGGSLSEESHLAFVKSVAFHFVQFCLGAKPGEGVIINGDLVFGMALNLLVGRRWNEGFSETVTVIEPFLKK